MTHQKKDMDLLLVTSILIALHKSSDARWSQRAEEALSALMRIALSRKNAIAAAHRFREQRDLAIQGIVKASLVSASQK